MNTRVMQIGLALALSGSLALGGVLFGTVKDENGNPIAGAEVTVFGKELSTKTDKDGKFRISSDELLDGNKYSVTVTADGYDVAQTISVEMYDDPAEMEPIEIEMYKTEELPVETNAPPTEAETAGELAPEPPAVDTNAPADTDTAPDEDLLDVEAPAATNTPPAR